MNIELPALVQSRVVHSPTGCILWTGAKTDGYGEAWIPELKQPRTVHRWVYEQVNGPVPTGLDVGHICHDEDTACPGGECFHRACCNPEHLRAQTRSENNYGGRLGDVQRARFAAITHCPRGHEYTVENTYNRSDRKYGGRMCRICQNERSRRWKEAKRAALAA